MLVGAQLLCLIYGKLLRDYIAIYSHGNHSYYESKIILNYQQT